jgi:hypothetical protein
VTAAATWDVETARSIERAVLDYFDDAGRMARVLHPQLAKRTLADGEVWRLLHAPWQPA